MLLIEVNTYHGIYILNILLYLFSSYFLTWGKEWPLGISTNASVGYAKRTYREASFFRVKQKNDEYNVALSIWHKKIHYAGFTPRLTWVYAKTNSNLPIYSYDKNQILFEVSKSF